TYDIARHYRDEIVPLRQSMADENVLRYNGMLIGVFELLAEARDQISSVTNAINAQQQFWLADAALAASVIGKPSAMASPAAGGASSQAAAAPAH
ncbi:MAG: transporter, partial [Hyphomicrobiales bacterium]